MSISYWRKIGETAYYPQPENALSMAQPLFAAKP